MNPSHRVTRGERKLRLALQSPAGSPQAEPPLDDEALIEAVVRHDVRRAGALHDRLVPVIDATLYRVLGKREGDHDDLVQTTFEHVVVALMRRRFARGCSLTTWVSSIAAHVAFNTLRARRRARRVFDPVELMEVADHRKQGDGEREVGFREQLRVVQKHLASMKPANAMVLLLHDVLGHELVEIGAMLEISVAAAQSRLVRGRRDLLGRLEAHGALGQEGHDRVCW